MRVPERRRLDVYLGAELVGQLERRGPTRLRFTYSARVLEQLVVERFDRERRHGATLGRIHQEDLCQALGVLPQAKYESGGGPSVREAVQLLREIGGPRVAREILHSR